MPNIKNIKLKNSLKRPINKRSKKFIKLNEINLPDNLNELNQLNSYVNRREKLNPESLYTKMVSDIKQTCPINLVSKNLVKFHNSTVFRYIVVSEPSRPVSILLFYFSLF